MIIGATRGSFPKLKKTETPEKTETPDERRHRYEEWLISTRSTALDEQEARRANMCKENGATFYPRTTLGNHLDPEYDAVMYQTHRTPTVTRPSKSLSIRARCWQCIDGDHNTAADGVAGKARITECASRGCALWSVRPYQPKESKVVRKIAADINLRGSGLSGYDHGGKALANPGNKGLAIKGYCHQCCGGRPDMTAGREVKACTSVTCAIWVVRPGATAISTPLNQALTWVSPAPKIGVGV